MINHEQAIHDERALIGRLMLGAGHTNEVFQTLPKDAFTDPRHAQLYELIFAMHRHGDPIDLPYIEKVLRYNGDLATTVGGAGLYAMIVAAESCPPKKVLSLACTIADRADEPRLAPLSVQPVEASHFTHLPVSVPSGILIFPLGTEEQVPQCTGMNSNGRCRSGLYPGQWEEWVIEGLGYVSAADGREVDPDIFLRQRCEKHLSESSAAAEPEWEWFDPQRFPGLVHPHRNIWTPGSLITMPRRPVKPLRKSAPIAAAPADSTPAQQRPDVPTALYWHYDAVGVLLYIGITDGLVTRGKSHAARSSWALFAKTSKSVWHPNRPEAEAAEVAAIKAERPLFNHTHNDTPEARARLVAYLIEHGRMDLLAPAVSRG